MLAQGKTGVNWTASPGWAYVPGGKGIEAYQSYANKVTNGK